MAEKTFDVLLKILLIGDMGVGKSCIYFFFSPTFSQIGVDFKIRTVNKDGKQIKLQIWDTAGQERFRTITTSYYKGAHGVIMVYDITKRESFESLPNWFNDIKQYADQDVGVILVGNKADLDNLRQVPKSDAEGWAGTHSIPFLETSAKNNTNVESAFMNMVSKIMEKKKDTQLSTNENAVQISSVEGPKKKKKPCTLL